MKAKGVAERSAPLMRKDFIIRSNSNNLRHVANVEESLQAIGDRSIKRSILLARPGQFKHSLYHTSKIEQPNAFEVAPVQELVQVISYNTIRGSDPKNKTQPKIIVKPHSESSQKMGNTKSGYLHTFAKEPNFQNLSRFFKPPVYSQSRKATHDSLAATKAKMKDTISCIGMTSATGDKKIEEAEEQMFKETNPYNLANAKRYNLKDLELDDNFFVDTIIPYEKAYECFSKINKDYSIRNLKVNMIEINMILDQEYSSISGACQPKDLVELCYHMLLYDIIEEKTIFLNTIALMLQGMEKMILPPEDGDSGKLFKKSFAMLLSILKSMRDSRISILDSCYNSFNAVADRLHLTYEDTLTEYLISVLQFIENALGIEYADMNKTEKSRKDRNHTIYPVKFFEEIMRVSRIRVLICQDDRLRDAFVKFYASLNNTLLQISLNKVVGTKKQLFTATWLSIVLEMVKYPSMDRLLENTAANTGYNRETIFQSVFTLIFVSCKHDVPSQEVKEVIKQALMNLHKMVSQASSGINNLKPITDTEYFLKVYFKLHFDEDSQFLRATNMDICPHLTRFIKDIVICSEQGPKQVLKKYGLEFNSAIRRYNELLPSLHKLRGYQALCNESLKTFISILKL